LTGDNAEVDTSPTRGRARGRSGGRAARGGRAAAGGESERRAAIVEIAAGLFAERGYRATTVREIADAAGMLSGSLYHHFDSKESIVDELLSSFLDDLHARHAAIAAARAGPGDTIAALVRAAFATIALHRAAVTVFQNERGYLATLPRFAYLRASEEESQRLWLAALRDGVAAGELRAELDPRLTHRFLRDAIWVSVHWYSPDGPLGPAELAEQFLTTVFDGIRVRPAG
jgi:AcrR family transcriptional regulator